MTKVYICGKCWVLSKQDVNKYWRCNNCWRKVLVIWWKYGYVLNLKMQHMKSLEKEYQKLLKQFRWIKAQNDNYYSIIRDVENILVVWDENSNKKKLILQTISLWLEKNRLLNKVYWLLEPDDELPF